MKITRRTLGRLSVAAPFAALPAVVVAGGGAGDGNGGDGEAPDWPDWAPTRRSLYREYARLANAGAQDVRSFGARLDGVADDTDAFQRAMDAADVLTVPGGAGSVARITRQLHIRRPVTVLGIGPAPVLRAECPEPDLFAARPDGDDPLRFLGPVRLDNLAIERPEPFKPHGMVLRGHNLRKVCATRISARRMGIVGLHHTRQRLRQYRLDSARSPADRTPDPALDPTGDPAVAAGFSASAADDLCEDLAVFDCAVDARTFASQLVRFEFTRRVAIAYNRGRFASISWWGGGARLNQGGAVDHLRRARDIYICDNAVSGSIAGIYGNNGQNVLVARNEVRDVIDVGIDFEGCVDAVARDNRVLNAGNFCFATFYSARGVVFEDNLGMQDGSARGIHQRYGARAIGPVAGRALLALRSAGFARPEGAVRVAFRRNRLVWAGSEGFGTCLPSYFGELELSDNVFENVTCDLRYRQTGSLVLARNSFTFDRAGGPSPVDLLGGSALAMEIADNRIAVSAGLPAGSSAIAVQVGRFSRKARISGNTVRSPVALPITVDGRAVADGVVSAQGNTGTEMVRTTSAAAQPPARRPLD